MKNLFVFIIFGILFSQLHAKSIEEIKEICTTRADIVYAIAKERDAGKTKQQIRKITEEKLGKKFRNSLDTMINSMFNEGRLISPDYAKGIHLYSCHVEFGIIDPTEYGFLDYLPR